MSALRNLLFNPSSMQTPQSGDYHDDQEVSPETEKATRCYMNVHFWRTDGYEGRCGHSSVSLHKEADGAMEQEYGGMWPDKKNIALLSHPLAYLLASVKGEVHADRASCEMREGEKEPLKPDIVYSVDVDQETYSELKAQMARDKADVESGYVKYSLFPRINTLSVARFAAEETFVNAFTNSLVYDLGDDGMDPDPRLLDAASEIRKMRSEHCTTFVKSYVEKAGYPVKTSPTPWMISPVGLEDQLEENDSFSVSYTSPPKESSKSHFVSEEWE